MADLIQNVQEVYKKWESRSIPNRGRSRCNSFRNRPQKSYRNEDKSDTFYRSRGSRDSRRPRYTAPKYDSLAEFKMAPTVAPLQNPRPYVGIPCAKCVPRSKAGIDDSTVYLLSVYNVLRIPYFPLESLNICCIWNVLKMNQLFHHHDFSYDLLKCRQIEDAIQNVVDASTKDDSSDVVNSETLYQRSKGILCNLKASISSICMLTTAFLLHHVFKRYFNGIFVHKGQMEILKTLSKEGIPFVYLPLHRSYFDYILVSYVLHMNSLKTPYVVVSDKLHIPVIRNMGAIFVRSNLISSNLETDILYDVIVKNYIVRCLGSNNDIQLFIEGSCSMSGKPQLPNINLFSAVVNSVSEGSIEDAYIVPVSITYDSTEQHAADQLETTESESVRKETSLISKLCYLWKLIHLTYGNVRLNFNQPFSVKEFLREHSKSCSQLSLPFNSDVEGLSKSQVQVMDLATHVIYDATQSSSLMSTHLLAFLFVTQYRKGGTQQQLQTSMDWLRDEINRKKWDLGFSGESLPVINRVVELFGKELISVETIDMEWTSSDMENNNVKVKVYSPVLKLPHVLELQYYANAVVPIFVKESIVVNALYALVDVDICHFHHCDSRFYVTREELLQKSIKLNGFLKYEFITMTPCQDITSVFNDVIDKLTEKECLSSSGAEQRYFNSYKKSHALSFNISSDEEQDDCEVVQQLKIDLREESISQLEFLRNILSPYIESYWLAACSLLRLIDEVKEESVFIREMQMTAEDKLYKGLLAYEESFSATTLKNALKMFCDLSIIEYCVVDNIKTLCLSDPYNSIEGINEIIADIEDFRK